MKEVKKLLLLILILLAAVYEDYRKGIIPNKLIILGFILGIIRLIIGKEIGELLLYLPGILIPILLFYPIFKIGGIGGGDLKLFSMMGIYLSFWQLIYSILLTFIIAAFLSWFQMILNHNFKQRISYLFSYIQQIIKSGTIHYYYPDTEQEEVIKKTKIRLAGPILLAVLITGGIL
ncbi:MAG: prepilin peptidase [Lachnospiraceae bacterium]|nr:prepilin peptidase [Lachnospiraceae bacterium]